ARVFSLPAPCPGPLQAYACRLRPATPRDAATRAVTYNPRHTSPVRVAAMNHLCTIVQKSCGAGLIIDYGAMRWQPGDSLQALRKHQSVNPFTADADTDITSHVNFEELHAIAKAFNLTTTLTHQRDFLHHHGIRERLSVLARNNPNQQESLYQGYARLVNPDDMGSIFKALEIYAAVQIPAAKNTPS
ncbi:MAG: SAM-dependent methyltransferase, partial [Holosporales bacterium]